MKPQFRIEGQYFDDSYEMGVMIQLKEVASGNLSLKSPLELFNDLDMLAKLPPGDVRMIGFMVGDYQMYLTQKLMREGSFMHFNNHRVN